MGKEPLARGGRVPDGGSRGSTQRHGRGFRGRGSGQPTLENARFYWIVYEVLPQSPALRSISSPFSRLMPQRLGVSLKAKCFSESEKTTGQNADHW